MKNKIWILKEVVKSLFTLKEGKIVITGNYNDCSKTYKSLNL